MKNIIIDLIKGFIITVTMLGTLIYWIYSYPY